MKTLDLRMKAIIASLVVVLGITGYIHQLPKNAINVLVDGQVVGNTLLQEETENLVGTLIASDLEKGPYKLIAKSSVTFEPVTIKKENFTDPEDLKTAISDALLYNALGQTLTIDGESFMTFGSLDETEKFLTSVKSQFLQNNEVIVSAEYVENIQVIEEEVELSSIVSYDQAWNAFIEGKDELLTYKIAPGDTTWDIASKFDMYVSDIAAANPEIDIELLQIGQEIKLNIPMAFINVRTVTSEVIEEAIINKTVYEKTNTMYVGESKLKKEGVDGKKVLEVERISINGVLEEQVVLSEEIVSEPESTVILSGSKWREVASSGEFIKPTTGSITSRFGMRWGRLHAGIDIGTKIGTPVKAADHGIVTKVGYISGYGKTVILDHGNGRTTLYGHLSGYNVQVGQSAAKGTVIAYSGNTGNVTGPCLHFEVREKGTPIDPLKYVDLKK